MKDFCQKARNKAILYYNFGYIIQNFWQLESLIYLTIVRWHVTVEMTKMCNFGIVNSFKSIFPVICVEIIIKINVNFRKTRRPFFRKIIQIKVTPGIFENRSQAAISNGCCTPPTIRRINFVTDAGCIFFVWRTFFPVILIWSYPPISCSFVNITSIVTFETTSCSLNRKIFEKNNLNNSRW